MTSGRFLSIGEIFDRAFRIAARGWAPFLLLAIIAFIPSLTAQIATDPTASASGSPLSAIGRPYLDVAYLIGGLAMALGSAFTCVLAGFLAAGLAPNLGDALERLRERWSIAGPTIVLVAIFFFLQMVLDAQATLATRFYYEQTRPWWASIVLASRPVSNLLIGLTYTIVELCLCAALLEDSSTSVARRALRAIWSRGTGLTIVGVMMGVTALVWFGNHLAADIQAILYAAFELDGVWMAAAATLLFIAPAFAVANVTVVSCYLDARLRQGHDVVAALAAPADLSPSE